MHILLLLFGKNVTLRNLDICVLNLSSSHIARLVANESLRSVEQSSCRRQPEFLNSNRGRCLLSMSIALSTVWVTLQ